MSYPYSQINRLDEPHNYMYTPFQGKALLQSYVSNRMAILNSPPALICDSIKPDEIIVSYAILKLEKLVDANSPEVAKHFRTLLTNGGENIFEQIKTEASTVKDLGLDLKHFTTTKSIATLELLHALIAIQLTCAKDTETKPWLDRLTQRFEVTKKIYENYPPGFRKGEGINTSVRLYWLFALALCLFYSRSDEIKYLSTLLKVCDLLCSLPENMLTKHIPKHGLSIVLATEIVSVQRLAEKQMEGR
ncbi:MAG: hypothetical protein OEM02_09410 [Desulfobulbaceae bacterium]|nr:hypothetical protein [Desulfobulbaceae bacterium]